MVLTKAWHKWCLRERKMKEKPCRRALINYGFLLSCCFAGTQLRDRWRLPECRAWAGQQPARVDSLHVRGEDRESRAEGKREQVGGFELWAGGRRGRGLWTGTRGTTWAFCFESQVQGTAVADSIIKKHHMLSKLLSLVLDMVGSRVIHEAYTLADHKDDNEWGRACKQGRQERSAKFTHLTNRCWIFITTWVRYCVNEQNRKYKARSLCFLANILLHSEATNEKFGGSEIYTMLHGYIQWRKNQKTEMSRLDGGKPNCK